MSESASAHSGALVAHDQRTAAIAQLVFEYGGVAGAVRRIVFGWRGRFSSVQIRIALTRRWPLLVPNKYQIDDCIEFMEKQRVIECVLQKHSKIYQRLKPRYASNSFSKMVGAENSGGRKTVHPARPAQGRARSEDGRHAIHVHRDAVQAVQEIRGEAMPVRDQYHAPSLFHLRPRVSADDPARSTQIIFQARRV